MVTWWSIRPGYEGPADIKTVADLAATITFEELKAKMIEYGFLKYCPPEEVDVAIHAYFNLPEGSKWCHIYKKDEEPGQISMNAWGGTPGRDCQEIFCRAFSILVLDKCYRQELNVEVLIK